PPAGSPAAGAVVADRVHRATTPISTTFPSDPSLTRRSIHASSRSSQEARRLLPRSTTAQGLRVLRRQDRPDRLQGGQPPPPLPLRAGQDRAATQDRHVRRPPARALRGVEARPARRPPPLRAAAPSALLAADSAPGLPSGLNGSRT